MFRLNLGCRFWVLLQRFHSSYRLVNEMCSMPIHTHDAHNQISKECMFPFLAYNFYIFDNQTSSQGTKKRRIFLIREQGK